MSASLVGSEMCIRDSTYDTWWDTCECRYCCSEESRSQWPPGLCSTIAGASRGSSASGSKQ
eukprot:4621396-Alexandrium_andersonii.AAC.1